MLEFKAVLLDDGLHGDVDIVGQQLVAMALLAVVRRGAHVPGAERRGVERRGSVCGAACGTRAARARRVRGVAWRAMGAGAVRCGMQCGTRRARQMYHCARTAQAFLMRVAFGESHARTPLPLILRALPNVRSNQYGRPPRSRLLGSPAAA